ncbi:hypothetical protein [Ruminococcus sp. HUN007]|uniref:hypothetical protein n=1 Tax=Ruminococcus sp. HUN007 TaxID=1514668 RepID=UPI0006794FA8|nr:hypothetical protein [Ruminococcus sp. HUN007]
MKKIFILTAVLSAFILTGCSSAAGSDENSGLGEITLSVTEAEVTEAETEAQSEETTQAEVTELAVASGDDVIEADEVGFEGMEEISADKVKDGTYHIDVDSSSSMFKIADCELTAEEGTLTAKLTINSKSYDHLFAGTAEEAAQADESSFIEPEETDEGRVFTVSVEALNKKVNLAAFSHKKQLWYDRVLVFRADSLPEGVVPEKEKITASTLGIEDGEYTVEVKLEGGSGKASVESPAKISVKNGETTAVLKWSSDKYDYMIVDGEKYLPEITDGSSVFEVPLSSFDTELKMNADTTAMSTPHEIEYTLFFDSSTIS